MAATYLLTALNGLVSAPARSRKMPRGRRRDSGGADILSASFPKRSGMDNSIANRVILFQPATLPALCPSLGDALTMATRGRHGPLFAVAAKPMPSAPIPK
jgi:hypothetical protein